MNAACYVYRAILAMIMVSVWGGAAVAETAYEAVLPAELHSSPALCQMVPCKSVLPEAATFSERKGNPAYVEGYKDEQGKRKLVGYVMLSTDITDIPGYSGKPIVTLMGMDATGHFAGVRILKHSEPILLLGIPEESLTRFNN